MCFGNRMKSNKTDIIAAHMVHIFSRNINVLLQHIWSIFEVEIPIFAERVYIILVSIAVVFDWPERAGFPAGPDFPSRDNIDISAFEPEGCKYR